MEKAIAFFLFFTTVVVLGIFVFLGIVFAKEVNSNFEINGKITNLTPDNVVFKDKNIAPQASVLFTAQVGDILNFSKNNQEYLSKTIKSKDDALLYIFPSTVQNFQSIMNANIINNSSENVILTADGTNIITLAPGANLRITVYEGEVFGFGGKALYSVSDLSQSTISYNNNGAVSTY